MADQWYYSEQGQRRGPVSEGELKGMAINGRIRPSDMVWKEGMPQWLQACQVQGLFPPQSPSAPPPMVPPPPVDNPLPNKGLNPALIAIAEWATGCLGHILLGQTKKGLFLLAGMIVGTCTCLLPGLVVWIAGIVDAYKVAQAVQAGEQVGENEYRVKFLYEIMKLVDKSATCRP